MVLWRPTRPFRTNTQKRCPFHYRGLECKSRKSRNTWSNRQIWPWCTEWSRAKANRVLPREHSGHSKHTSKVMLKILQTRLQQCVNRELPDAQAGFRKGRGTRDQIANIRWIIKKAREFQKKHLLLLYWLCQSLCICRSQQTVENSERDGNTIPPDLPPEKSICRSKNKQN